ncbi:MAG TPA: [Fe-Fe] hydrogenase large subunit C-terminal domain-containing protein [Candidatus Atribacteria bacterium]|nr:[Fe-Fe] hydrogenase large subunit C-terminal domain-containing protein [Candidatus Atribacteria bacterium]
MGVISTIEARCRDCYKCIRNCPVKAIRVSLGHAEVVDERCIKDGRCVLVCPQDAKKIQNDLPRVQELLRGEDPVVVSLAPSFVAAFSEGTEGQIVAALKKLGFQEVRETAEGAEWVAKEHTRLLSEGRKNIISSSCPAINALIYKYYPQYVSYLAPVVSPMIAHARLIRQEYGKVKVVFIGPCIAKKAEVEEEEVKGEVDAVLTFEELKTWFQEENISLSVLEEEEMGLSSVEWGRAFPVEGGLLKTASLDTGILSKEVMVITGIDRCRQFLDDLENARSSFEMVEMMSCEGGCIDGPVLQSLLSPYERRKKVIDYTEKAKMVYNPPPEKKFISLPSFSRDFVPHPVPRPEVPEEEIKRILSLTGKFSPQDELNCGACGYNTCREKAQAVYQGMAEAEMCIPFMRAKAESFSSFLIAVTPNGIVLVDENLRIVDVNPALRRMFGLTGKLVVGSKLDQFIDPSPFVEVLRTKRVVTKEVSYPQYQNLYVQLSVFYLEKSQLLMGVFVDLTKEREREALMEQIREKTLEKAQQVINNQMTVAQEIASLLGETTAETKVLLNKLMKILRGESVEE